MHMPRVCVAIGVLAVVVGLLAPARADLPVASVEALRPIFGRLLGDPPVMRMDVVPDLSEGGYARVIVYAQRAAVGGMRVDELWIRLTGASVDPAELRQGTLKVLRVLDSGLYGKVNLASVEAFLEAQGTVRDVKLTQDSDLIDAKGTMLLSGALVRVRMRGVFQVSGDPEIYFHIESLFVNSLPLPTAVVDRLERSMNPVVDFRTWPVAFKIRSLRSTPDGFVLSSLRDFAQPCNDCGGPELRLAP